MKKIAFLFLVYDTVEHREVWEQFFENAPKNKYSIYSHPKKITNNTPDWIKKNKVNTVQTGWCSENLLKAYFQLLKEAFKDRTNTKFILVSGTCIPLYTFDDVYKKVMATSKATFNYYKEGVFEKDPEYYKADQWSILNRKVAKDLMNLYSTKKGIHFRKTMKKKYKDHGVLIYNVKKADTIRYSDWMGNCPDEFYPMQWFIKLYGKPSSKKFRENISFRKSTYLVWDSMMTHPLKFNKPLLKKHRRKLCNGEAILARKFRKNTAKIVGMNCKKLTKNKKN